jgi:hypothetical protein
MVGQHPKAYLLGRVIEINGPIKHLLTISHSGFVCFAARLDSEHDLGLADGAAVKPEVELLTDFSATLCAGS